MPPDPIEWERLGQLAFRRHERIGADFRRVCRVLRTHPAHWDIASLQIIKEWMLMPFTLWPVDFTGLSRHVCKRIRSGKRLEAQIVFGLERLRQLPTTREQEAISEYERFVEQGNYEPLIRAKTKYSAQEQEVLTDKRLHAEWREIKRLFNIEKFRDRKGIVRRRMAQERNFRSNWEFKTSTPKERFPMVFDAFCYRWNLYGMEGDKPLLLKLSVNPTAHGLMIVIPSYWSLDSKRDLDWKALNKLHKARGALRQGSKMAEFRVERHQQARRAFEAAEEAKRQRLRGDDRLNFIASHAGIPITTEPRIIRRLVSEGRSLVATPHTRDRQAVSLPRRPGKDDATTIVASTLRGRAVSFRESAA